jgi:glycosyltransferase involved in cell wall biosynthesis
MRAEDDIASMRDLLRLVGPNGVVNVSVSSPLWQWTTAEWSFADPGRWNQLRSYGAEFGAEMCAAFPGLHGVAAIGADPVTLSQDITYFFSFSEAALAALAQVLQRDRVPLVRYLPQGVPHKRATPVLRPQAPARTKTVGLQRRTYAEVRNITCLNTHRVTFVDAPSDFSGVASKLKEAMEQSPAMRENAVCPVPDASIDCYHFFNSIPLNDVPFVCTFETSLPRWMGADLDTWRAGIDILASENCRRLFAISDSAMEFMRGGLRRFGADITKRVMDKVDLLYPPQSLPATPTTEEKFSRTQLEFALVGRDFLRKGGYETLLAFEQLLQRGADIRLHVVSPLRPVSGGASFPWNAAAEQRLQQCVSIIKRFPKRISHRPALANENVLELFARSHVGLLPSFHETFGYAVIEAQSRLCPMVTTKQRAFAEINNAAVGWLVDLPFEFATARDLADEAKFNEASAALTEQLTKVLQEIVDGGVDAISQKAIGARKRIRLFHDPKNIEDCVFSYY